MGNSYNTVTELPGNKASAEQIQRFFTRYHFAKHFCNNKDVLEAACGAGQGLGYLAQTANKVVGCDIDEQILKFPCQHYQDRANIEIRQADVMQLPFSDNSFDIIIFYEAIYYLKNPEKFFKEAWRILREDGRLIIGTVNKDWSDFNPSPFSHKYYSVPELYEASKRHGFRDVKFFGDCPVTVRSFRDKVVSFIKRAAVKLYLIPKTMKGKELYKRLFMGKLAPLPSEVTAEMAVYTQPIPIPAKPNPNYKILFCIAEK